MRRHPRERFEPPSALLRFCLVCGRSLCELGCHKFLFDPSDPVRVARLAGGLPERVRELATDVVARRNSPKVT
jgi:hypothetical protein